MSSKSKANCSASMVAATVGRAGSPNVGTLFVVRPFPPSETPFSFMASASSGVPAPIPSRAIRSSSSSVNCSRTSWRVPPSCMMICAASSRSWEPKSTSDAAAEDVEGVVPKESQESGPSKMPSLIRVSSFTVTLGPSCTQTLVIEPVEPVGRGRAVSSTVGDLVSGELARAVLACPRVPGRARRCIR